MLPRTIDRIVVRGAGLPGPEDAGARGADEAFEAVAGDAQTLEGAAEEAGCAQAVPGFCVVFAA